MTAEQTAESSTARRFRRTAFVFGGVLVAMLAAWVLSDPRENLATDWTAFDTAADRLFSGEDVYRPWSDTERLPYLYPPPALLLAAPLKLVGFYGSFLMSFLLAGTATVLAIAMLARFGGPSPDRKAAATVAVLNGFVITSTLIGQYSGLWLLALTVALWKWSEGDEMLSGVALAFLVLKPNLAVPVVVLLLWSRSWRVLYGGALGMIGLVIASLPLGLDQWRGFGINLCAAADLQSLSVLDGLCAGTNRTFNDSAFKDVAPVDKMITGQSSVSTTLGLGTDSPISSSIWVAIVAVCGLAVLELWRRPALRASVPRAFGALVLFLVAANPRLYFYDGVLLLLPALVFWATGSAWISCERAVRISWWLVGSLWIASWGGIWRDLNVLTGPLAMVLLVTWAVDSRLSSAPARAAADDESETPEMAEKTVPAMGKSARKPAKSGPSGL